MIVPVGFFPETTPIPDCHNIRVTRRKQYFVNSWTGPECLTNEGLTAFMFRAEKSLSIEASLTLVKPNAREGGIVTVTLDSSASNDSISLSTQMVHIDKTINSNKMLLGTSSDGIILIGVQGYWLNSIFTFLLMNYM